MVIGTAASVLEQQSTRDAAYETERIAREAMERERAQREAEERRRWEEEQARREAEEVSECTCFIGILRWRCVGMLNVEC